MASKKNGDMEGSRAGRKRRPGTGSGGDGDIARLRARCEKLQARLDRLQTKHKEEIAIHKERIKKIRETAGEKRRRRKEERNHQRGNPPGEAAGAVFRPARAGRRNGPHGAGGADMGEWRNCATKLPTGGSW